MRKTLGDNFGKNLYCKINKTILSNNRLPMPADKNVSLLKSD
jgi:hypothetical protein